MEIIITEIRKIMVGQNPTGLEINPITNQKNLCNQF